jgi:hypothetical protein
MTRAAQNLIYAVLTMYQEDRRADERGGRPKSVRPIADG